MQWNTLSPILLIELSIIFSSFFFFSHFCFTLYVFWLWCFYVWYIPDRLTDDISAWAWMRKRHFIPSEIFTKRLSRLLSGNIGFHQACCRRRRAINQICTKKTRKNRQRWFGNLGLFFFLLSGTFFALQRKPQFLSLNYTFHGLLGTGRSLGRWGSSGLRFIAADGQIEGAEWSQLHQILSRSAEAEIPFNTVHSNYPSVEKKNGRKQNGWS